MKEHVKSLTLTATLFESPFPEGSEKSQPHLSTQDSIIISGDDDIWNRPRKALLYLRPFRSPRRRPEDIIHDLDRFVRSLDRVAHLTIDSHFNHTLIPNSTCSLRFLGAGWHAFGQTLRSLTLKGNLSLLESVLEDSIYLASLERLSVDLARNKHGVEVGAAYFALTQFIKRHSTALSTLEIVSADLADSNWFSQGLERLPRLQRLKIQQPPSEDHGQRSAMRQFLLRHIDTIVDLEWGYTDTHTPYKDDRGASEESGSPPPLDITFPHIQRFAVCGSCPGSVYLQSAMTFIERHQKTLTSLSFISWSLGFKDFIRLAEKAASPVMEELDCDVFILTSSVFATLKVHFPSLQALGLSYGMLGRTLRETPPSRDPNIPITSVDELDSLDISGGLRLKVFGKDMDAVMLADWPIERLNLRESRRLVNKADYRIECVGKVIVARLPKVGFVNGMYRENFVAS
ncbi:hypothetical protein NP233_g8689 [Leucocoprinus birnbaumii]|uniref:Uncharacterized protein n=1 Tax=Leucocoprinus birnbaumii TaxID=56174 RepID=A0AAD5VLX2_9AGAR|nr:hypothetical protein NP233_g8689 [Leucocoprinus birnbaumii]